MKIIKWIKSLFLRKRVVWVVHYGNYYPPEVDSIWSTKEKAQQRIDELDETDPGPWEMM